MTSVSHATAMYATKRRRRNSKNVRTVCSKDSHSKSNPSKRHRERLNQELDTLASLLPFESSVLSKLDKLSILRLSVSYLRTKSYFQAALASKRLLGNGATGSLQQVPANTPHHNQHYHSQQFGNQQLEPPNSSQQQHYPAELRLEGDLIVQALNGFLLILTCDGEVFYTSHTVETYLGFHQSDICHQSVYELVHSEDREELMQQLKWNSMMTQNLALTTNTTNTTATTAAPTTNLLDQGNSALDQQQKNVSQMSLQEVLASADHRHLLERNFTVRFRCLLDNTSGFLRLDIRGRIKVLHGQQNQQNLANSTTNAACNKKQSQQLHAAATSPDSQPMLAFFGVCVPFGPPSLLEMPSKDSVFKSKHRLDLSIISMDSRGKNLIGLTDLNGNKLAAGDLSPADGDIKPKLEPSGTAKSPAGSQSSNCKQQGGISAYDLVHHDDLSYMASAHQELLKTGASGLIAYRMIVQSEAGNKHQWLQTSAKLYYKNSKPDFILCTHRPLMEEEGRDLLGKRTMDFKVTYLDVGLSSINDRIMACDKFSSLQALERGGNSAKSNQSRASRSPLTGTSALALNGQHPSNNSVLTSSPALSAGESSRSLNSLSPQSNLTFEDGQVARISGKSQPGKRISNKQYQTYDLNNHHQYLGDYDGSQLSGTQHYNSNTSTTYDTQHYKRSQNGDIFYDMDGSLEDAASRKLSSASGNNKKKLAGNKASCKQATKTNGSNHIAKKSKTSSVDHLTTLTNQQQLNSTNLHQQSATTAAANSVDQQLHLYNHYTNQHHHLHNSQEADPTAAYPAIQAAAVYAASLGHPHSVATAGHHHHHHHQGAYATVGNQLSSYTHPHHNSMYGASSMVSPASSAAYAAHHHHQHHQHHSHLLDSAANYHQSASHYGAFASAAGHQQSSAGSFLPTERLLHHYSQSARSAAALAAWQPTSGSAGASSTVGSVSSSNSDYHQHHHLASGATHHHHQADSQAYGSSGTNAWGAAAAAAALAAGVSDKRDTQDTYTSQQTSTTTIDPYGQQTRSNNNDNQYQQHHNHTLNQQSSMLGDSASPVSATKSRYSNNLSVNGQHHSDALKSHGPASLSSDGSAHRSPLSSGESSNGSGSLTAAQAAAVAAASSSTSLSTSGDSSAMISPSAYYLPVTSNQHQHEQQLQRAQHSQQQQEQQHQQSTYTHHQQSHQHHQQLAAYHHHHQNPYAAAAVAQQYSDSAATAAAAVQFNHYHHHQQMGTSAAEAAYFQHHHASASELVESAQSSGHVGASSALSAVKLYGANDRWNIATKNSISLLDGQRERDPVQHNNKESVDGDEESESTSNGDEDEEESEEDDDEDENDSPNKQGDGIYGKATVSDQEKRDPLAQLISSTIGEIMLDIEPKTDDQLSNTI